MSKLEVTSVGGAEVRVETADVEGTSGMRTV